MDGLIILLVIWFAIDILGGNKKKQQQNQQKKSVDEMRRAMEESQSWLEKQSLQDEIEQEQLRDLQENQRAQRKVEAERRQLQRQNRSRTIIFGDLGEFIREFKDLMDVDSVPPQNSSQPENQPEISPAPVFSEMTKEDISRRKQELREKKKRRLSRQNVETAPADECTYCTGETAIEQGLERTAPAKTVVLPTRKVRDVAEACRELQLNELQQAVVWAEVLDKPLALRKRR